MVAGEKTLRVNKNLVDGLPLLKQKGKIMLEKLKASKGKIVGNFGAVVVGLVFAGFLATLLKEEIGYSGFGLYAFAVLAHGKVAKLLESKVK